MTAGCKVAGTEQAMFEDWRDFFFLIGSASAGLIGMLTVVATLIAGGERVRASRGTRIYTTPTVFHFAVVLVLSALALMPSVSTGLVKLADGLAGLAGLAYAASVAARIYTIRVPKPHPSDIWYYGFAPAVIYLALGLTTALTMSLAAYALALSLLSLLVVGIRNAWDLVTYLALHQDEVSADQKPPGESKQD